MEHVDRQDSATELNGDVNLLDEGQRVQRVIAQYAQMSQAATKSTKIIAESLSLLKPTEPNRRSWS